MKLFKEASQKIPRDNPNMDCPLSQFTMKTRFKHCSDDLTHPTWSSLSLHTACPLHWSLWLNTPTVVGSDVGSHSHAEDTMETESNLNSGLKPDLVPRIIWIMSLKRGGRLPLCFSDNVHLLALYFVHLIFMKSLQSK